MQPSEYFRLGESCSPRQNYQDSHLFFTCRATQIHTKLNLTQQAVPNIN